MWVLVWMGTEGCTNRIHFHDRVKFVHVCVGNSQGSCVYHLCDAKLCCLFNALGHGCHQHRCFSVSLIVAPTSYRLNTTYIEQGLNDEFGAKMKLCTCGV